ncbi:hypothetical protein TNCV_4573131 [Trichonephila clavipes]|nr:hypothetical protein TNCV_4573131 [Trichonephila clavipes]
MAGMSEFEPSTTKDPPCRAAMHADLSRAETSSRWYKKEYLIVLIGNKWIYDQPFLPLNEILVFGCKKCDVSVICTRFSISINGERPSSLPTESSESQTSTKTFPASPPKRNLTDIRSILSPDLEQRLVSVAFVQPQAVE